MPRAQILELVTPKGVLADLQAQLENAEEQVIRVGAPALRVALREGEKDAERRINAYWNNIPRFVDKHVYNYDFNRKNLSGKVAASGRKVELRRFLSRVEMRKAYFRGQQWATGFPRSKGVAVKAYRKQPARVYPGTFVAEMRNGFLNIFKRRGRARYEIDVQYAERDMNWPLLVQADEFEAKAAAVFAAELNKILDAEGF